MPTLEQLIESGHSPESAAAVLNATPAKRLISAIVATKTLEELERVLEGELASASDPRDFTRAERLEVYSAIDGRREALTRSPEPEPEADEPEVSSTMPPPHRELELEPDLEREAHALAVVQGIHEDDVD